jgi:hypothetical protein
MWALLFVGCIDGGFEEPADSDDGCAVPAAGRWEASGTCFAAPMSTTLTPDGVCGFTLTAWSGGFAAPDGGVVDGTDVTLGSGAWGDCAGELIGDAEIVGECVGGCGFVLRAEG